MKPPAHGFHDASAVVTYAAGPRRQVPGYDSLLLMADVLLSERVQSGGHILVVGAGGGQEMALFAQNHPSWHLTGVDPSAAMLDLARQAMGPSVQRATLVQGYIDDAPAGPFDGATCLLTLHFVALPDRLPTLRAIRDRMVPGAPFVCAHFSVPGDAAERQLWFARYAAFSERSGMDGERARAGAAKVAAELPVLTPEEDEALLVQAGFDQIRPFYLGFTFRGWVARA